MSSAAVTIHFPYGGSEYRLTEKEIEVGQELRRNGDTWVVIAVTDETDGTTTVSVRPKAEPETNGTPADS